MTLTVLDSRLLDLVSEGVVVDKISTGHRFTEGPVWHHRDRVLTFSDVFGRKMHRWTEQGGTVTLRDPSGEGNGNTYDHQGNLITCEHQNRRISRTLADGTIETVVDRYEGGRFNSPNDVICAPNGDLIFTDPTFGLRQPDGTMLEQEYPCAGVFRFSPADGSLRLLVEDVVSPNGLALSDDGKTFYVDDSRELNVRAFDVADDGSLSNSRVVCKVEYQEESALPDGMKLDSLGNLYVTPNNRLGVWVYAPDGTLLGMIGVGEERSIFRDAPGGPANLCWGGDDWQTMFVTAVSSVYRLRMKVPGQPVRLA
jgi:gluconolactonase